MRRVDFNELKEVFDLTAHEIKVLRGLWDLRVIHSGRQPSLDELLAHMAHYWDFEIRNDLEAIEKAQRTIIRRDKHIAKLRGRLERLKRFADSTVI